MIPDTDEFVGFRRLEDQCGLDWSGVEGSAADGIF